MSSTPTGYGYPGRAIKTAAAFPWLGYSGDDPCAGERATDPLHRARIDVHDVLTSEFINVGVIMLVPSQGRVIAKTRHTIARLRGVFPDLDRTAFTSMMANIRRVESATILRTRRSCPQ
jgi:Protein of unknown function (DUF3037)